MRSIFCPLFGEGSSPSQAVFLELQHSTTAPKVRHWLADLPPWLEVRTVTSFADATLLALDVGEREAIQLALELGVRTVLIDGADGRKAAERLHLEVRGTLGILERGAKLGKISFRHAWRKLEQTSFRASPAGRMEEFFNNREKLGLTKGKYTTANDGDILKRYGMEYVGPPIDLNSVTG